MKKNMKLALNDIVGEVVKDNETYLLKDNKTLKTGTCTIVGQYFNATEINRPPVNPNK